VERHEIIELMGQLKLAGMRAAYDEVITAGLRAQHSVQRIIGELLLAQLADNRARSTAYRLGVARFPVMKNLAEFDFSVSPVNQGLVRELHEGGFLVTQRNAVLIGGTGTGKSHVSKRSAPIACATARAFGSSPQSTWSISSRPKRVPEKPGASPINSSASISSSSTSWVTCHSRSAAGRCCST
jgi:hypothetical protein